MCSWYVIQLHSRVVHVLEEFMLEAGATKGRDLRLEVRRVRSGASRDRHGDVVWLDFTAAQGNEEGKRDEHHPHRHLVVDVTVASARTNTNVPRINARSLPLHGSLHQHGKLDADLRTSALLGKSSVKSINEYYPFALRGWGPVGAHGG
jgi:hypothetical protein